MGLVHHVTFKRCKNDFFSARTMAATGSPPSHTVGTIIRHAASLPCVPVAGENIFQFHIWWTNHISYFFHLQQDCWCGQITSSEEQWGGATMCPVSWGTGSKTHLRVEWGHKGVIVVLIKLVLSNDTKETIIVLPFFAYIQHKVIGQHKWHGEAYQ